MSVSKYPVEISDREGQVDAINYLLSGPAGLGQNFSGFSTYVPAYLRPSSFQPFVTPNPVPIKQFYAINNAQPCDSNGVPVIPGTLTRYVKLTFTTPFVITPFTYGQSVDVINVNPGFYNDVYKVWSGTVNDVIIYAQQEYIWPAYISGGDVGVDFSNITISTDCNGRVTVNGGSDRVFVSGQLILNSTYDCTMPSEFDIIINIRRLTGYLSTSPGSTDYVFGSPITVVAERRYHYNITGAGSITDLETIFTQFIDGPDIPFGYYWYLLDFEFATIDVNGNPYPGDATLGPVELGLRSLTAQVVKQ